MIWPFNKRGLLPLVDEPQRVKALRNAIMAQLAAARAAGLDVESVTITRNGPAYVFKIEVKK